MSGQEEISKETEEMTLTASPENCSDEMPEQEGSKEEVAAMDELCLSVGDKRISIEEEGVGTELIQVGTKDIRGCISCNKLLESGTWIYRG